jgi:hypothetical protein
MTTGWSSQVAREPHKLEVAGSNPAPVIDPAILAKSIQAAWGKFLERGRRQSSPHPHVYASAWRACVRRMTLEMTASDQSPSLPAEVLAKFRRGDDRERDLLIDLARIGRDADPPFSVVGQQQRFELKDRKGRVAIVGKVDARLRIDRVEAPLEVKAWSPHLVDRIETFVDLFDNPWTRSGGVQLLSYLYGSNEPFGFLLLDRSGIPALLPVELDAHLDRMEDFLTRAETALDHERAGTLPDFLVGDAAECQRCPFYGSTCNPPLSHPGATVLTDPELEVILERRAQLEAAADEFDRLDKDVKKRLRGIEHGIAGAFQIEGRWGKQSRTELPADLKAKYTVTDPKGKFFLEVTRL